MWRKFVRSAPSTHASTLADIHWREGMGPTVDDLSNRLQRYEENLSVPLRACISAVEKLSQQVHHLEEHISSSSPVWTSISAIKNQRSPARGREYHGHTARGTLWFYLQYQGEDTRKWDGEPTSILAARVRELQGNVAAKRSSPRKITAPVSVGQSPRGNRRADVTADPDEGTSASYVQELSERYSNQD